MTGRARETPPGAPGGASVVDCCYKATKPRVILPGYVLRPILGVTQGPLAAGRNAGSAGTTEDDSPQVIQYSKNRTVENGKSRPFARVEVTYFRLRAYEQHKGKETGFLGVALPRACCAF